MMSMNLYKKIMIFGSPGGGKSTFAYQLHRMTGLPLYHLDKYFFTHNWQIREYQEFLNNLQSFVNQPSWIIDGNGTRSLEMRWARADLILYFHRPRWLCYYRVIKRLFNKNKFIDDRGENCPETVRLDLLKYMWTFADRVEPLISNYRQSYPTTLFVEIKSDIDLDHVMTEIMQSN